jgi:hypothetical protein
MVKWIFHRGHGRIRRRLDAFLRGELTPEQQEAVERHLAQCAGCRAALQGLREMDRALSEARPEPPALSPEASDALFLRALEGSRSRPRRSAGRAAPAMGLAVVLGILLWLVCRLPETYAPVLLSRHTGGGDSAGSRANGPRSRQEASSFSPRRSPESSMAANARKASNLAAASFPLYALQWSHPEPSPDADRAFLAEDVLAAGEAFPPETLPAPGADAFGTPPQDNSALPPGAHLVVIVEGPSAPRLNVTVEAGPQSQPGYARIAALNTDEQGSGFWKQCTIRDDLKSETISTTQYRFVSGQAVSCLALETTENSSH